MTEDKIQRINELARKQKTSGLTPEEQIEQNTLRKEYIESFKRSLTSQLDSIVVQEADGSRHKLKPKNNE